MEAVKRITLDYCPRPQFLPFHDRKERWAVIVAHRRAGKTVACINELIKSALECKDEHGRFAYLAPLWNQAKDVAWEYLKHFARPVLASPPNESELRVDLVNGSRIRLYGADNPERLRGGYFHGIILDEYADMRPSVWGEVIRPALADKQGWATFIGTPKGRVGLYDLWAGINQWKDVDLFRLMLKASETHLVPDKELKEASRTMSEEQYAQEFECSFEAAILGAYYGKLMARAEQEKRITGVPYEPTAQVWTAWDLGIADATAIWWAQVVGREIHLCDYYEASGADLGHYVQQVVARPGVYAGHIVPHDAQAKELGTGKSRLEVLQSLGLNNLTVCPQHRVEDGINAVRTILPRCWFDRAKCERGIDALKLYRSEYDEKLQTLKPRPVHDWASHGADAFRYLAMTLDRSDAAKSNFYRKINYPSAGIV